MTRRTCPWCGGPGLTLTNVSGMDPKRQYASFLYWEDRDCGYREKTSSDEYYDYQKSQFVQCEREVISFHKPRAPLTAYQLPEYLRNGTMIPQRPAEQATIIPEAAL